MANKADYFRPTLIYVPELLQFVSPLSARAKFYFTKVLNIFLLRSYLTSAGKPVKYEIHTHIHEQFR